MFRIYGSFDAAYGYPLFTFGGGNMNAHSRRCVLISLSAIVICGESALAQSQQQDEERLRREGVERADAAARAQGMEQTRQLQERERQEEERRRSQSQSSPSTGGGYTPSPSGGSSAGTDADMRALGKELFACRRSRSNATCCWAAGVSRAAASRATPSRAESLSWPLLGEGRSSLAT